MTLIIQDDQAAAAFLKCPGYQIPGSFPGKSSHHQLDGVLVKTAQGHPLPKRCDLTIDACLAESFKKGLCENLLMKPFATGYLWGQNPWMFAPIPLLNLLHNFIHGLSGQSPVTPRTVLMAEFAVEKSQKMIDFREGGDGGASAPVADPLLDGHGCGEAQNCVHIRSLQDFHILPNIGSESLQIAALTLGKQNVVGKGRFA
ncbi:hypothetical protein LCGC14_2611110 [marine sediment metagenome]|uniref:Uncharacterized protein n=1 Tax=marine sediment metagenome TaxID=412755 RepID=A0A0F9CGW9_9ZZZZ